MGLIDLASNASVWKGYYYFEDKKVSSYKKISDIEYESIVNGSNNKKYNTIINIKHPKKSKCNCPHAKDTLKICKHMVALYFTVFPDEADLLIKEAEEYEKEEEQRLSDLYDELDSYLKKMSKAELYEALNEVLNISPDWLLDYFVRERLGKRL